MAATAMACAPARASRRRRGSSQDGGSASASPPTSSSSSSSPSPSSSAATAFSDAKEARDDATIDMPPTPTGTDAADSLWSRMRTWVDAEELDISADRSRRRVTLRGGKSRGGYRSLRAPHEPEREDADEQRDDDDVDGDDDHAPLAQTLYSGSRSGASTTMLGVPMPAPDHVRAFAGSFLESSWVLLLLLGVTASVVAWSIDNGVQLVTHYRAVFASLGGGWLSDYLLYVSYRVFILLLGVLCTWLVCPDAAGSGIPEMRSILGGFPFPNYLTARALMAKCLGLVFALGSGLSIGKEGPFVHLSCIIARQLLRIPLFRQIRQSEDLTHHVLSAACAVGVTATFGTPIGGVLFSIEVTTSYYVTSNYWRAFFASVVGVVVFRALGTLLRSNAVSLFTTAFDVLPYQTYEVALFLILALLCGILAALFVRTFRLVSDLKSRFLEEVVFTNLPSARSFSPFVYAAAVALLFSLIEFPVGSFMLLSQHQVIDDMFSTANLTSHDASHLASEVGASWSSASVALYTFVRFFSTAISATVMVPSGIVTPVFAIGAALGRLFGEMVLVFGGGSELAAGYAVVGAASFTAGVTGTISIAVIVFELTSQLSYMVPVLLCVLIGRSVALFFSLDMYETISRQKRLPQWPTLTQQRSYALVASDLMSDDPPLSMARFQTLESLKRLLCQLSHDVDIIPVIDSAKTEILLGAVDRDELEAVVLAWERCLAADSVSKDVKMRKTARVPSSMTLFITREQQAALSQPQSERSTPIDLVAFELLELDTESFRVHKDAAASHAVLLIAVHKCPQLFVTARGKLLGVIHASDVLARARKYAL